MVHEGVQEVGLIAGPKGTALARHGGVCLETDVPNALLPTRALCPILLYEGEDKLDSDEDVEDGSDNDQPAEIGSVEMPVSDATPSTEPAVEAPCAPEAEPIGLEGPDLLDIPLPCCPGMSIREGKRGKERWMPVHSLASPSCDLLFVCMVHSEPWLLGSLSLNERCAHTISFNFLF